MFGAHANKGSGFVVNVTGNRPEIFYAFEDELYQYSLETYRDSLNRTPPILVLCVAIQSFRAKAAAEAHQQAGRRRFALHRNRSNHEYFAE